MPLFRYNPKVNGVVYDGLDGPLLFLPNNMTTGTVFYLDAVNGNDNNPGTSPGSAVKTLTAGYALLTDGHHDVLAVIGGATTASSVRLSTTFTWAKNCAHLIGVSAPSYMHWTRIAPTSAITAFTPFMTISGSGCLFANLEFWDGFASGTTSQIGLNITGGRNVFLRCDICGMGDTASAQSTGSRSIIIAGDENTFLSCEIGCDTVLRTVANYSVEMQSNAARTVFEDCIFAQFSSSNDTAVLYAAAGGFAFDRWVIFRRCSFINALASAGYLVATGVATLGASQTGFVLFQNCVCVGFTGYGHDVTTKPFLRIAGGGEAANTTLSETGIAVTPNA